MFDGGVKKLLAPLRVPVPAWLREQAARGPVGHKMYAALQRVDVASLAAGTTVYPGGEGRVGVLADVLRSGPGRLGFESTENGVVVQLSILAIDREGPVQQVDWIFGCIIDGDDLLISLVTGRTKGKELCNELLFVKLRKAVIEAISEPPRLHRTRDVTEVFELVERVQGPEQLPLQLVWTAPWSLPVPQTVATTVDAVAARTIGAAQRAALEAESSWPLVVHDGSSWRIQATSTLAQRTLITLLLLARPGADQVTKDEISGVVDRLKIAKPLTNVTSTGSAPPVQMISSSSRFMPLSVSGARSSGVPNADDEQLITSLWPCVGRVLEQTTAARIKKEDLMIPFRVGLVDVDKFGTSKFSSGPSLRGDEIGPMQRRYFAETDWSVSCLPESEGRSDHFEARITGNSWIASSSVIPGSDNLLEWLWNIGWQFEAPVGSGGATFTLVDRAG